MEKGRVGELKRLFEEAANRTCSTGEVAITSGKKVYEVRPKVDWDKGKAVDLLMNLCGHDEPFPIFIGDDLTDEDGFTLVNQRGGLSIFVGGLTTKSSAGYVVDSPSEVADFLDRVLGISVRRHLHR